MDAAATPSLKVQLNHIDYILEKPGPLDRCHLPVVPVIRVFGPSEATGQQTCVHIHQVYPYFFLEYTGLITSQSVTVFRKNLIRSLNHAISLSLKRNPDSPTSKYVRAVSLVKGIPFYGFHFGYSPFLLVHLTHPGMLNRAVKILQSGSVMGTKFRVFESHIGYILQFLADFGLYGCGWLELGEVLRRQQPTANTQDHDLKSAGTSSFPSSTQYAVSRMALEVDVVAPQILNRRKLVARHLHQTLEIHEQKEVTGDPLVISVRELWEDERRRRVERGLDPSPEMPVDPSTSSRTVTSQWSFEAQWWEQLRRRIEQDTAPPLQESNPPEWQNYVPTTFDSVEVLWEKAARSSPLAEEEVAEELEQSDEDADGVVQVDVTILASQTGMIIPEVDQDIDSRYEREEEEDINQQEETEDYLRDLEEDIPPPLPLATGDEDADREASHDPFLDQDQPNGEVIPEFKIHRPPLKMDSVRNVDDSRAADLSSTWKSSEREQVFNSEGTRFEPHHSPPGESNEAAHHSITASDNSETEELKKPEPPTEPRKPTLKPLTHSMQINFDQLFAYTTEPPTSAVLLDSLGTHGLPSKVYRKAFYSNADDVPFAPKTYGGLTFELGSSAVSELKDWDSSPHSSSTDAELQADCDEITWEYATVPPGYSEVKRWLIKHSAAVSKRTAPKTPQVAGLNPGPQKEDTNEAARKDTKTKARRRFDMSMFCLEIFAPSLNEHVPDPEIDEIQAAFYTFQSSQGKVRRGIVAVGCPQFRDQRLRSLKLEVVSDELDLINRLLDIVWELDPSVLAGWDIQFGSWGFLNSRAQARDLEIANLLSRAPLFRAGVAEKWEVRKNAPFKVSGRHCINLWRIMRVELTLRIYTLENVALHVLNRRVPQYSYGTLNSLFQEAPARTAKLLEYFAMRTSLVLDILNGTEFVTKTAEFARVFGIDFYSVITRGSQYKVESFMFRLAKPEGYVLPSPSRTDVGEQNAAECMPLIMEPQAAFYSSPLVVLDFQSLYPSAMIAYNLCFSTCLGRVVDFQGRNKLGIADLEHPPGLLARLKDHITIAPNGIMYVKPTVRRGVLGRMLAELLDTRVMVKQAMKSVKDDKVLRRILDARQRGLKYIANVTYGYTSASFSGRMPAVEIADSIVQIGRETLERAIALVNSTAKWNAEVVYGDTDSLFIYLKGRTKEQAFRIGHEIADTVTAMNPAPMKLKFEKVYLPGLLMAKKRYVGNAYEGVDDKESFFDAKGIETVRRDGVIAQANMVEKCLKILFTRQDLSAVKAYCCRSWQSILDGEVSIQDFTFAKEVRLGSYSDRGPPPPGAVTALLDKDKSHTQYGMRVRYVIAEGELGARLVDRAVAPIEMLQDQSLALDAQYYISRVLIPPLERIFNLMGADVKEWYEEMMKSDDLEAPLTDANDVEEGELPASAENSPQNSPHGSPPEISETDHFDDEEGEEGSISRCVVCEQFSEIMICDACLERKPETISTMLHHARRNDHRLHAALTVCRACSRTQPDEPIECISLDCPWFYARLKAEDLTEEAQELEDLGTITELYDPDASEASEDEARPEDGEDWEGYITPDWESDDSDSLSFI